MGIRFAVDEKDIPRDDCKIVIDEANREDFYREYTKIIEARKGKK